MAKLPSARTMMSAVPICNASSDHVLDEILVPGCNDDDDDGLVLLVRERLFVVRVMVAPCFNFFLWRLDKAPTLCCACFASCRDTRIRQSGTVELVICVLAALNSPQNFKIRCCVSHVCVRRSFFAECPIPDFLSVIQHCMLLDYIIGNVGKNNSR